MAGSSSQIHDGVLCLQNSPALPNEVWAEIFYQYLLLLLCTAPLKTRLSILESGRETWFLVSSRNARDLVADIEKVQLVCRRWYGIVMETPRLWALGCITLSRLKRNRGIISRSGKCSLTFWDDQRALLDRQVAKGSVGPSITTLFPLALDEIYPRLRVFSYGGDADTLGYVVSEILPELLELETLYLYWKPFTASYTDDPMIPQIQLPPPRTDWTKLRSLTLWGFLIEDCVPNQIGGMLVLNVELFVNRDGPKRGIMPQTLLKILHSCTLLETVDLRGDLHNFPETIPDQMDPTPIRLPHLQYFEFGDPGPRPVTLLKRIIAPPDAKFRITCQADYTDDTFPSGGIGRPLSSILSAGVPFTAYLRQIEFRRDYAIQGWNTLLSIAPSPINFTQTGYPGELEAFSDGDAELAGADHNLLIDLQGYIFESVVKFEALVDLTVHLNLGQNIEVATLVFDQYEHIPMSANGWADIFRGMRSLRILRMSISVWLPVLEGLAGGAYQDGLTVATNSDGLNLPNVSSASHTVPSLPCPNLNHLSLVFRCDTFERQFSESSQTQIPADFAPHVPNLDKVAILTCLERRKQAQAQLASNASASILDEIGLHFVYSHEVMREYRDFLVPHLTGLVKLVQFESGKAPGDFVSDSYDY